VLAGTDTHIYIWLLFVYYAGVVLQRRKELSVTHVQWFVIDICSIWHCVMLYVMCQL